MVESNIVGDIKYKGNKKIKDSKFKEELEINTGQRIKPNMLHEIIKKIKMLYAEKGYLKVDIKADLINSEMKQNIFDGKAKNITKDEMIYLLEKLKFPNDFVGLRDKMILEMFYSTGIRLSELINLKISLYLIAF